MRWIITIIGVGLMLHACDHPDYWLVFAIGLILMCLGMVLLQVQLEARAQAQAQLHQLEPRRRVSFTVHRGL